MLGRRDAEGNSDHKFKDGGEGCNEEGDEHIALDNVHNGHHLRKALSEVQRNNAQEPFAVAHVVHLHDGVLGCLVNDRAACVHLIDLVLRKAGGHVLNENEQNERHTKQDQHRQEQSFHNVF